MTAFPFHAQVKQFDLTNACQLAAAAELVYGTLQQVETTALAWGMSSVDFFDISGTQAFVAANDELVLVAFRGTEPNRLEDWITDSRVELVAGPVGGRVHAGFYSALSHVWHQLASRVYQLTAEHSRPVWVTGHSLGAALATLATARWLDAGQAVQGLYTFGQPRTGDETFARNFNFAFKPYAYRIVNHNDLVTRVPPRSFGYSHTGTFKYFTDTGYLVDSIDWWHQFLSSWQAAFEDFFDWAGDGVRDHNMCQYRQLLGSAAYTLNYSWADRWQQFVRAFGLRNAA